MRFTENPDNLGVREPLGDLTATSQPRAQFRAGDIESAGILGDLVNGRILVLVGEVGNHLEGNDLNAKLVAVLLNGILGIIWAVEINTLAVLTGTGVITADDEVGRTVVLADDGVPDGLTGTTHSHGQGQKTQDSHTVGVSRQESLVYTHTGEVIDITGLGQADDGVDKDVGMVRTSSADS